MRLRSKNGKERTKRSANPHRHKRWPVPIARRLDGQMNGSEQFIWHYFNKADLIKEMQIDCPNLKFNKRDNKLVLIRLWIKNGCPEATDEYIIREERYDQWQHDKVLKIQEARRRREALGISSSDSA